MRTRQGYLGCKRVSKNLKEVTSLIILEIVITSQHTLDQSVAKIKFHSLIMRILRYHHHFHPYYVNFMQKLEESNFNHKLQFLILHNSLFFLLCIVFR